MDKHRLIPDFARYGNVQNVKSICQSSTGQNEPVLSRFPVFLDFMDDFSVQAEKF
jgi:hypothetical protein